VFYPESEQRMVWSLDASQELVTRYSSTAIALTRENPKQKEMD